MNSNIVSFFYIISFRFLAVFSKHDNSNIIRSNALIDHTKVSDSHVFPYVVAVLKKFSYASAGALLSEEWVLTAADSLYLVRESSRNVRVRLGSVNYKKGGIVVPVKKIIVHPYFDDSKPAYDVALILLGHRVRLTPYLYPIRLQKKLKEVVATHFIVTSWTPTLHITPTGSHQEIISMEALKQRRILSLSHLHPSETTLCLDELRSMDINDTSALMCLDPDFKSDPCWRDTGAPVVLNGILWGIVSSWRPDDCYLEPGTSFVTLVAAANVSNWIHSTTSEFRKASSVKKESRYDDYYDI